MVRPTPLLGLIASCVLAGAVTPAVAAAQEQPPAERVTAGPEYGAERLPPRDAGLVLPRPVDDAHPGGGARSREGGRGPDAGPARGRAADEGPRAPGQGRPELHLPRRREGPFEHPARRAPRHVRRGPAARPDGRAAPGGRPDRRRAGAGRGRSQHPGPVRGDARRPGARRLPRRLQGPAGHLLGVPHRGQRGASRLRRRRRDHRSHDALREARREPGHPRRDPRVPARAPVRRLHLRLRPSPQAVALDAAAGRFAVAPAARGSRPGLRPLRGPDRAGRGRLRAPDPHLRRQVRQDPGPHLQRPRAGPLAARRSSSARRGTKRPRRCRPR